jgi:hypothetical protein
MDQINEKIIPFEKVTSLVFFKPFLNHKFRKTHHTMSLTTRLNNGWKLSMASFEVLKKNKQLLFFPLLSVISLLLTVASFVTVILSAFGWNFFTTLHRGTPAQYILTFCFYLINYFVIVFFNMALIHCVRLYFHGEQPSVGKGLAFSLSRIGDIFAWAVFAATVGLILNILENNLGKIGKIITGLLGIAWSITTFFVVPVIAYEHLGPVGAFKRSASIMKEKWGESLAANFSFFVIHIIAFAVIILPLIALGVWGHEFLAVVIGLILFSGLAIILSAIKMIFITAVYQHVNNIPVTGFDHQALDSAFIQHKKGIL